MIPAGALTTRQVADLVNVSPATVRAALHGGRLFGLKMGHQWFIEKRALTPAVVASLQESEHRRASQREKPLSQPGTVSSASTRGWRSL